MPLIHGKGQKAFEKNIKTEMEHGKPQKQALAIAYSVKRKAQHKAKGGEVHHIHKKMPTVEIKPHPAELAELSPEQVAHARKRFAEKPSHTEREPDLQADYHIGYKGKKMAHGGDVKGVHSEEKAHHYYDKAGHKEGGVSVAGSLARQAKHPKSYEEYAGGESAKQIHREKLQEMRSMKKPQLMAHGGEMHEEMHSPHLPAKEEHLAKVFHEEEMDGMAAHEHYKAKHNMAAEHEDARKLGQHGAMEIGPEDHYAYGGLGEHHEAHELHGVEEGHQDENHEEDLVGKILRKRQHMYSKGGMVANEMHREFANRQPAEYDYLAKYDDMADHHSAGNLHGSKLNQEPVHEEHDIVSRILRKRHGR